MAEKVAMRVSLCGQARNAAAELDKCAKQLRELNQWTDDSADDDPGGKADYYAFALRELAQHAEGVVAGTFSVEEFAEFYCLSPRKK